MLVQWIKYLTRRAAPELRALGYLRESIAIEARWRRCHAAWEPHLIQSQKAVGEAIGRARRHRTAVILGSGLLLDVPLPALARAFERVVLVDALHPPRSRRRARAYANVELLAADVTGTLASLHRLDPSRTFAAPQPGAPPLLEDPAVDLVVSLNLLSQLPVLPVAYLDRKWGAVAQSAIAAFAQSLIAHHLDMLARCSAATLLVSDVERRLVAPDGAVIERHSTLAEVAPPKAARSWTWQIAPRGELDSSHAEERLVIAAYDLARVGP
ncbi:MAG: hypothetical protein HYR63_21280 [Proteobacteria bacterium]|nr:hypothetical protein [Pseudomonadota bacterium]MBI3500087.1 hypothetical protein [Pseudomonadota bacterium]